MAGRKRKAEAARAAEEEADRALYGAFRGAANSLSQLYALAGAHQRLSFHAGERHALEKLYQWMVRQHEIGLRLTVSDIASHIQNEIEYGGDNALTSPRSQHAFQNLQAPMHIPNTSTQQPPSCSITPSNPSKDSMIFSKALSSPVRQNLQLYHVQQGGDTGCFADGIFCPGNRDSDPAASNDSSGFHGPLRPYETAKGADPAEHWLGQGFHQSDQKCREYFFERREAELNV
uniref:Holocarboxylase synthetase n=1 Tax=Oryza nivara TaxID=4536 RepID=A0A0E0IBI0_ORYNI